MRLFAGGNRRGYLLLWSRDLFNHGCRTAMFLVMNLVDVVPGVQEQVLGDERSDANHRSDNEPEEVHASPIKTRSLIAFTNESSPSFDDVIRPNKSVDAKRENRKENVKEQAFGIFAVFFASFIGFLGGGMNDIHAIDTERQKTKNQIFEQSAISL